MKLSSYFRSLLAGAGFAAMMGSPDIAMASTEEFVFFTPQTPITDAIIASDARYLILGPVSAAPIGHVELCEREPVRCNDTDAGYNVVDAKVLPQVGEINTRINHEVIGMEDIDLFGVVERWQLPVPDPIRPDVYYGDCDDYVLMKRDALIKSGIPESAISTAIVSTNGRNNWESLDHAVLVLRTTEGDLILDNLTDEMKTPIETGYTFFKMTSFTDNNEWRDASANYPDVQGYDIFQVAGESTSTTEPVAPVPAPRPSWRMP